MSHGNYVSGSMTANKKKEITQNYFVVFFARINMVNNQLVYHKYNPALTLKYLT